MPEQKKGFTIDLEQIIAAKFGGRKLPGPLLRFLKRFLHIDYLNAFFEKGYEGVEFCTEAVKYLGVTLDVKGLENIPADGTRYTFACNHPLGGIDGVALASLVGTAFGSVGALMNDFLLAVPGLRPLGIPVNKVGSQARNLVSLVNDMFQSDKQIMIFPAGLCSRKIDGKIQDLPWTKTFITQSKASGRKIVPVFFDAVNSPRFYRIARLRKKLGIKFNIEMITLPDEMYRARGQHFTVRFGTPVPPEFFNSSKTPLQWAAWVREQVYQI